MARRRLLIGILTTVLLAFMSAPAQASATGHVNFECEAYFPTWPTPISTGRCNSGFPIQSAEVQMVGLDNSSLPYVVAGLGEFNSDFSYSTACIATEPPLVWNANGQMAVLDVDAVRGGIVTSADLGWPFTITGIGSHVIILGGPVGISFRSGGTAQSVAPGGGEGSLVAVTTLNNVCPQGGELHGVIVGHVDWPA